MKSYISRCKPWLRWLILGITLFFLATAIKNHWREVAALQITGKSWGYLAVAWVVTFLAHIWSAWVWLWILTELKYGGDKGIDFRRGIQIYLKTNIAKYIPGNIWHFYGRIVATKNAGIALGIATLSVLLEPLLMAAAALFIALITLESAHLWLQILCLIVVLAAVHPRLLNPVLGWLGRVKLRSENFSDFKDKYTDTIQLQRYPIKPFLGELVFVGLRGIGFILTLLAMGYFNWLEVPRVFGAFSLAWLLGLVVPGAPGGLGVFEATVLGLLESSIAPGILLGTIAFYRVVSITAETAAAAWAAGDEKARNSR
ncbi:MULTISPECIES: lysylphosphatidylglycerol synthase domain-containing protein [Oscillatoriales]|uniref:Integral membrane protein n=1 Tax=Limnospira platensis NIES-46 TaxID=1236695 RepID=A0A5M3T9B2_LIMPL|nr:lysylphosphatidylglycerol synthase domain-containing protein [Arthrospira platensis]MDF2209598.1 lysylphosphatidylglycerol synthase domain-containing protein [Arthrospira platensis NCB002]MDT9185370.1 lysylphosphatidylglycerol synthase domain-containing protein [Limnospira sp. PMC 289.06]BAI90358.1 hypothetical protein NIES39_E01250 [Arthrospira platensis NIES-39]BDT12663.1 hypothetical protein N39L_23860 [Arthrospira platensis NIES-39]GCE95015.1 hypothetical protein NIES46_30760 [Arthrospi